MNWGIVILISWAITVPMVFADAQAQFEDPEHARKFWRENLGFSIAWCFAVSLLGPLGVALAFCLTGFAKNGFHILPLHMR